MAFNNNPLISLHSSISTKTGVGDDNDDGDDNVENDEDDEDDSFFFSLLRR